jgi:hypothetical protein
MKRRVMHIAWAIRNQFNTFSEALTHAWKVIKLQWKLCTEAIVEFKYKKIDGSIREARGSNANLPYTGKPVRTPNFGLLTYFDLDAQAFRSAKIENLLW